MISKNARNTITTTSLGVFCMCSDNDISGGNKNRRRGGGSCPVLLELMLGRTHHLYVVIEIRRWRGQKGLLKVNRGKSRTNMG